MSHPRSLIILALIILFLVGCGGGEKSDAPELSPDGLTPYQLKNGIGPITTRVFYEAIDTAMVARGKATFDVKCVACHKVEARLVGPPLENVTKRRSPEFIMNMILNPEGMVKQHPEVKAMLATYYVPMTFQNVTQQDARDILEYLRTQETEEE